MSNPLSDRNLLLGVLALQFGLVSRDQLVDAISAWGSDKSQPLDEIFVRQKAITQDYRQRLTELVALHVQLHGGDVEKSLAALSSIAEVRSDLRCVDDSDLEASLLHLQSTTFPLKPEAQSQAPAHVATLSVGVPTSDGARFRILRPHAKGGLGEVSVAFDAELNREVALKEIQRQHADHSDSRSRFLLEAQITGGLEHPGIVPVYGMGTYADGWPFYAMRFIRGDSLKDGIQKFFAQYAKGNESGDGDKQIKLPARAYESFEFRKLLQRFIDVCNAIAYAHARGVLHRDLKPGNIMLGRYGETLIVDWGLAKATGKQTDAVETSQVPLTPSTDSSSAQTIMGSAFGTPAYMSPEQAAGKIQEFSPATDIYCLGATLYHLLTGRPPHTNNTEGRLLQRIQDGDFTKPREVNSAIPAPLAAICLKAMARSSTDRYASARNLANDVEHWLADEGVAAYCAPWHERLARMVRRHQVWFQAAAMFLLLFTIGTVVAAVWVNGARTRATQLAGELQTALEGERVQRQRADDERKTALNQTALANERLELAQRRAYHIQLSRAHDLFRDDPGQALELLNDDGLCPPHLREFAWGFIRRSAQRHRLHWRAHDGRVLFAGLTPDGTHVVSVGADRCVKIWMPKTTEMVREIRDWPGNLIDARLSPDGSQLAVVVSDGTIRFLSVPDGAAAGSITAEHGQANTLAFSSDGRFLAAGGAKGVVEIWNIESKTLDTKLEDLKRPVRTITFGLNDRSVIAGSGEFATGAERLIAWNLADQSVLYKLELQFSVQDIVPIDERGKIVFGTGLGQVGVFDPTTGRVQQLHQFGGTIKRIAAEPAASLIAVSGPRGAVRSGTHRHERPVMLWNSKSFDQRGYLPGLKTEPGVLTFSSDGRFLVTGNDEGFVDLWQIGDDRAEAVLANLGQVGHVEFVEAGKVLKIQAEAEIALDFASGDRLKLAPGSSARIQARIEDGLVSLADQETGRVITQVKDASVSRSPDGKWLGLTQRKEVIELRQPGKEQAIREFPGDTCEISSDGRYLAAVSGTDITIWDLARNEVVQRMKLDANYLRRLQFTPNNSLLVAQGGPQMQVWEVPTGRSLRTIKLSNDISAWALSPTGKSVAVGVETNQWGRGVPPAQIYVFDLLQESEPITLPGHQRRVSALVFSQSGELLASAGGDDKIKLFNTTDWKLRSEITSTEKEHSSVAFIDGGKGVAFVGAGGVYLGQLEDQQPPVVLSAAPPTVYQITVSPDGNTLAFRQAGDRAALWDLGQRRQRVALDRFRSRHSLFGVEFSSDSSRVAVSGPVHEIYIRDVATGKPIEMLQGDMLRFMPDGRRMLVAKTESRTDIYDALTGESAGSIAGDRLAFSADSRLAAAVTYSHEVIVWDLVARRMKQRLPVHGDYAYGLAFSPDGRFLLTQDGSSVVQLWSVETGERQLRGELPLERIFATVLSPTGGLLAVAGAPRKYNEPGDIVVFDVASGAKISTLKGHASDVYSLAFSPDEKTLASGGFDFTVRLWDPRAGQLLDTLTGHNGTVFSVAFSPDGAVLASGSYDGTVRLWASVPKPAKASPWTFARQPVKLGDGRSKSGASQE